jgi:predicted tellurium resistance membrane protein TerC
MAARNLPKHQQKAAILWGMAGAVAIRIAATALVVYLLKVPWLQLRRASAHLDRVQAARAGGRRT